jgi:hypothetical protein
MNSYIGAGPILGPALFFWLHATIEVMPTLRRFDPPLPHLHESN